MSGIRVQWFIDFSISQNALKWSKNKGFKKWTLEREFTRSNGNSRISNLQGLWEIVVLGRVLVTGSTTQSSSATLELGVDWREKGLYGCRWWVLPNGVTLGPKQLQRDSPFSCSGILLSALSLTWKENVFCLLPCKRQVNSGGLGSPSSSDEWDKLARIISLVAAVVAVVWLGGDHPEGTYGSPG